MGQFQWTNCHLGISATYA